MTRAAAKVWIAFAAVGVIAAGVILAAQQPEIAPTLRMLGLAMGATLFAAITFEAIRAVGPQEEILVMSFVLSDSQQTTVAVAFKDKRGNVTKADGIPAWTVSDPALLAVTPAADGLTAAVAAVGPVGAGSVTAKLGGVSASLDVQVVAGPPASAVVTAGDPVELS